MRPRRMLLVIPLTVVGVMGGLAATNEGMAVANGGEKVTGDDGVDVTIFPDTLNNHGNLTATGAIGTARYEPSNSQVPDKYIGCWIEGNSKGASVICKASSGDGQTPLQCMSAVTTNTTWGQMGNSFAAIVAAINSDSYLEFRTDINPTTHTGGACTWIHVENSSQYLPRQP